MLQGYAFKAGDLVVRDSSLDEKFGDHPFLSEDGQRFVWKKMKRGDVAVVIEAPTESREIANGDTVRNFFLIHIDNDEPVWDNSVFWAPMT